MCPNFGWLGTTGTHKFGRPDAIRLRMAQASADGRRREARNLFWRVSLRPDPNPRSVGADFLAPDERSRVILATQVTHAGRGRSIKDRWLSGLRHSTRNRAYPLKVPWVRLPPCPPLLLRGKSKVQRLQNSIALLKRYTSRKIYPFCLPRCPRRGDCVWQGVTIAGKLPAQDGRI